MAHVWEVILKGACAGQAIYNVLHFQDNGDLGIEDLAAELVTADPNFIGSLMPILCLDYTVGSILARSISPGPAGPQLEVPFPDGLHTGTYNSTAGALPSSAVAKWVTAEGGRSKRGRNYFGPLGSASNDDGLLGSTAWTAFQLFVSNVISTYTAGGGTYNGNWELVVWSRVLESFAEVVGGVARREMKTQRRRQLGVGI